MYFMGVVLFSLFFLISCSASGEVPKERNTTCEVFHYRKGVAEKILRSEDMIAYEVENIFFGADDTYRLIVSDKLLATIKKGEAVEVVYTKTRILKSAFLRREIEISRLIVPLEGKFASSHATVFYGNPDYGEFNVLVNKKDFPAISRIKELLK